MIKTHGVLMLEVVARHARHVRVIWSAMLLLGYAVLCVGVELFAAVAV